MIRPKNKLFSDLTGKTFGRLEVKEYAGCRYPDKKSKGHQWLCQCECGTNKVILGAGLARGTQSCGCVQKKSVTARMIDLTNQTFGKLRVEKLVGRKYNQPLWKCVCECGNIAEICGNNLKSGKTNSCGCRQGNFTHGMWGKPGYKAFVLRDPAKKLAHNVSTAVRQALAGKKRGGRTFSHLPYSPDQLKLHLESLWEPWMSWDNYGGPNDSPDKTWHIDHIVPQSKFSYTSLTDQQFTECWALSNLRPLEKSQNMRENYR